LQIADFAGDGIEILHTVPHKKVIAHITLRRECGKTAVPEGIPALLSFPHWSSLGYAANQINSLDKQMLKSFRKHHGTGPK
jgi:hypothetical protein